MHCRIMLSRLATQSCRGLAHSSKNVARYGGSGGQRWAQQQTGFNVRTGPTLKERLLGPTTGKPFVYGSMAVAGASALGVGALAYYGLGLSKERSILQDSSAWPQYVRDRLSSTYGYLAASLGVTAASGVAASRSAALMRLTSGGGLMVMLGTLAAIIATGTIARSIPYENTMAKHAAWLLHSGVMGAVLAPLCFLGGPVLVRAAWYTAGIVAGLSTVAMTAPSDKFLMMGGPLAMGLGVVFVANIGQFFLPPGSALGAGLASIVVYGGLILFSAFLLYDTQRVVKHATMHPQPGQYGGYGYEGHIGSFDPINAQMSIYMDVLNIFIRLAMIMSGMGGNKRK
uniref:Growth hormone-inducible transmembrane protein n=1 Tax=Pristionchus pacificus TaxID=54126 RepID=A0A8R1V3Y2_PRIPA